jgi:hypothetical protein
MSTNQDVDAMLAKHKRALTAYHEWDQKVKALLQGRRAQDLTADDMMAYREAATRRDAAYDEMRHLERMLLDDIPDSSAAYPAIEPDDIK